MEFDEIVVKETPGLCRCCLSEGCYKDLSTEYTWMEEQEIYADMLLECFDISISQHMEGPNGPNRLICEVCITRLRDACNFKKQVLDSEKKFVDMVGRGEFKAKAIEYVGQMKSEDILELQPVEETEIEYLEDDMDYDDGNRDDPEPTVSEDITVTALPIKGKRGRPKKTIVKSEKKKPKAEDKPKTKIAKDCKIQSVSPGLTATQRQNLQKFFANTSVIPFECNSGLCCFFCGKHISQHDHLKKHTKSHDSFTITNFFSDFASQIINVDVSEVNCDICDLNFDEFGSLIHHVTTTHDQKDVTAYVDVKKFRLIDIRCLECDKRFVNYSVLERHLHEMHEVSTSSNNYIYPNKNIIKLNSLSNKVSDKKKYSLDCPKCSKVLTSKLGYQLHLTKCGLNKEPTIFSERNTTPLKVRQNIASVISMSTAIPFKFFKNHFRCFYCSKDYADFDLLKEHTVTDHSNFKNEAKVMKKIKGKEVTVKIDILNLTCKLCFENLVDLSDLISHLTSNHGVNYDKSIECLQPFRIVKDNIHCPLCSDAVFRYFKKLLEHMNEIHSDNNIVCAHCGLTFRGHPNYRAHMSRYHRTRACKCPDCNMEFWNLEKLARHRANVHGTKKFKCPQCVEKFITNYMMRRHQIVAHGFGHKCPYCSKLFTRNSHMKNHVRRLHLKEKNVECNVCKEKFFDRALLNVHMVKHIGERNYHCDVCGKKFLWKKNLRGHMASHERNS